MPPSYRERLVTEGAVLAAAGAVGAVALLLLTDESTRSIGSTVGQLAVVVVLLATFGVRSVRRSIERARALEPGERLSGDPTPLWQHPLIVLALTALVVVPQAGLDLDASGWDAGLRVTVGCLLVGLAQAVAFERLVGADEARTGRRYVRAPGSSLFTGTKLAY